MRKRSWILGATALTLGMSAASAVQAQFYVTGQFGAGNTWNVYEARGYGTLGGNGRFRYENNASYETGAGATFVDAWAAAPTRTYTLNGTDYTGHLVSFADPVLGPLENDFIEDLAITSGNTWIGLTDSQDKGGADPDAATIHTDVNSGWVWQSGETYVNIGKWGGGEPNDCCNGEDGIHLRGDRLWNDNADGRPVGPGYPLGSPGPTYAYIVEYETRSATKPDLPPEPTVGTVAQPTPGPKSTQDGKMAIREIINNGGVSGNLGTINSLFSGPSNPNAIIRDYEDSVLNITNTGGTANFGGDKDFGVVRFGDRPGGDVDNLALRAGGRIRIPEGEGGTYTFHFNSDDSAELWIYGKMFTTPSGAGTVVSPYGSLLAAADRGPTDSFGQIDLAPGDYDFELVYNEAGGGSEVEFSAAKGAFTAFDSSQFELVGAPTLNYNATIPKVNAWTVREVIRLPEGSGNLDNLTQAKDLFNNPDADDEVYDGTVAFLNMADPEAAGGGNYPNNIPFLNDAGLGADDNDFVFRATGNLEITTAGEYSFWINSDDGAELTIDGASLTIQQSAVGAVLNNGGETVTMDALTGASATLVTATLPAGNHAIEFWMFERGGGAFAELAMAPGLYTAATFDARLFAPIGNTVQNLNVVTEGGLQLVKQEDAPVGQDGDTNGDGIVDLDDLNAVRNNFGNTGTPGSTPGDAFPFDGVVDLDDLNGVRNNFGAGPSNSVPEPSSFALIGLGLSGLFGLRRFRNKK
jgi:hypothetical protein